MKNPAMHEDKTAKLCGSIFCEVYKFCFMNKPKDS